MPLAFSQPFKNHLSLVGNANFGHLLTTVAPIAFTDDKLPLGVQIGGPRFGDPSCITFAGLLDEFQQGIVPFIGH